MADDRFDAETVATLYEKVCDLPSTRFLATHAPDNHTRPMTHTGTTAFLRQAHRNNWEQYLASLKPGAQQDWDICVLTASDERQAEVYGASWTGGAKPACCRTVCRPWCSPIPAAGGSARGARR